MLAILLAGALALPQTGSLTAAARAGDRERVRSILADGGEVDAADDNGRTALMEAAGRKDAALIRILLDAGADVSRRDANGVSALTIAKSTDASEIVDLLKDAGAEESLEERLDEAIRAGDLDAVDRAIAEGADVNALETASYQTPLMTALARRELQILSRLLDAGADPTREGTGIETTGENAITMAARQESPWAFRVLTRAGARRTDLERALFAGCASAPILTIAFEAGADVNAKDARGRTPLICAATEGASDAVETLLKLGANPEATTKDGRTAVDWAALRGHDEVVALLER